MDFEDGLADGDGGRATEALRRAEDGARFAKAEVAGLRRRLAQHAIVIYQAIPGTERAAAEVLATETARLSAQLEEPVRAIVSIMAQARDAHYASGNTPTAAVFNGVSLPLMLDHVGDLGRYASAMYVPMARNEAVAEIERLARLVREGVRAVAEDRSNGAPT